MNIKLFFWVIIFVFNFIGLNSLELVFNTQEFAPFSYNIDGVVSGPGVDVITAVCEKTGTIKPTFNLLPWTRAQQEVKDGKAHALFLIGKNKEREETFYFSHPIIITEYGFFVTTDNKKEFKDIVDFKEMTVGVYGPSNTATTLEEIKEKIKDMKIDQTVDDESGFRKLSYNRINAVFSNIDVGYALLKKLNIKNVKYVYSYKKIKYYVGFSKQFVDKKTVDKFNDAYTALYKEKTIKNIIDGYQMVIAPLE
ncbi:MAG: hypothetical protein A2086_07065 [Spirochaetes bacterium GWD1_27_9]|nr:MAG: hypothetical protein A2Z98_02060 [Spirochaetes bacterium GWB1_27_13]OHD22628.1 MAG: hypothetical protein A2Y34_13385 [Spirochaetes bacterium GWC1_27_15]OHD34348.1 MAG: hypothetical protein A2086_07065 [Spirochaetes bacterium GWD1_27_9]